MSGLQNLWMRADPAELRRWAAAAGTCAGAYLGWLSWRSIARQGRQAKEPHIKTFASAVEGAPGWFDCLICIRNRDQAIIAVESISAAGASGAKLLRRDRWNGRMLDPMLASGAIRIGAALDGISGTEMTRDSRAARAAYAASPPFWIDFSVYSQAVERMTDLAGRRPFRITVLVCCRTVAGAGKIRRYPVTLEAWTALAQPRH